ncbi:hypothetical protein JTE90_008783 [Oedothorax gibbosus]|uniref:Short-chain dehydrogenase/reductase 3 n=1 Tax=Oedothorax gibbosus TaxID=931172 RepID=A0AAV6V586_9ARAC|nr:hypothetical protein JTE90_008783 [Oedothorax gibbosus]
MVTVVEALDCTLQFLGLILRIVCVILRGCVLAFVPKSKKDLKGEVVLITGSAQGMGKQLAVDIARLGAKVVLWDINEEKLKEVAKEITESGGSAYYQVCDVSSEGDVTAKAEAVVQEVGEVTVLINNAGIMQNVPMLELSSARIRQTFEVNLLAHFWTIRAFLPSMQRHNRGHIVAIASAAGLVGHINQTDYSASKHGVVGMMEAFYEELRQQGSAIKLTTICPITVGTGMNHNPTTRFPWMMPIVPLEEAARKMLSAIRREDLIVTIPQRTSWLLAFSRIAPHQAMEEFIDFFGYCQVPNSKTD